MVGLAAIKQGRSANRKHTFFFFGLSGTANVLSNPPLVIDVAFGKIFIGYRVALPIAYCSRV